MLIQNYNMTVSTWKLNLDPCVINTAELSDIKVKHIG